MLTNESPNRPIDAENIPTVISHRGPTRPDRRPPIGATNRIIIVVGSVRRPAWIGS